MSAMQTTVAVEIPFQSFYESCHTMEIDREEEMFAVNWEEEHEREQPEHLRLSLADIANISFRVCHYGKAHEYIAEQYASAFGDHASELLGFPLNATYDGLSSPREYNFATDRLFVTVPLATMRRMFKLSKTHDDHATLAKMIRERFTSYDGFISHYRNDIAEWLEKPLASWDHNETGTLLRAALMIGGYSEEDSWGLFETLSERSVYTTAFDQALDYAAFQERVEEEREEKRQAYAEENPDCPDPECDPFWHYFSRDPNQLCLPGL